MSVPLKRLDLQGYKSFARKTEFLFEQGITAIVGPNGSGKSNLADAMRWVLGEQSYSTLRGKRTGDLIFSGSEGHRRLGMAQASLIFDNETGWLPIDFSEVTISRRAYRSGENEYLLNGNRVRLRDNIELLAEAGLSQRTYTVIGQGLVDRVLTLNPQERRLLFEEAAGIVGYQARRKEALHKLEETGDNLTRVRDITAEIAPRLARLARQAEETKQQAKLSKRLEEALHIWYGYQWQAGQDRLREARSAAQQQAALLAEMQAQLQSIQQEITRLQAEAQQLQAQWSTIREEWQALERTLAELNRERAVREERERLLLQRQAEIAEERWALQSQDTTQALRITEAESVLTQLEARCRQGRTEIERLEAESANLEREHSDLQTQVRALHQRAGELAQAQAEINAEWSQLRRRRPVLLEARLVGQEAMRREREKVTALKGERRAIAQHQEELATQLSTLEEQLQGLTEEQEVLQVRREELQGIRGGLERRLARLAERRELLSRMRRQGYYPGVQAVLQAAQEGQLTGLRGPVAELLKVPPQLEKAIQAALGNVCPGDRHLQDVVVEDREAAQCAIAFLRRSRAGRATFLPLKALRPPSLVEVPQMKGVIGRADDLVSVTEEMRGLTTYLLGRTLIVQDLEMAHHLLPTLKEGCQVVTLEGEVVRADGSLTGGSDPAAASGLLAREGEWRQLPQAEKELQRKREELDHQEHAWAARFESLRQRIAQTETDAQHLHAALAEQTAKGTSLHQALQRSVQTLDWQRERAAEREEELASLDEQKKQLQEALQGLEVEAAEIRAKVAELEEQERTSGAEEQRRELEKARTAFAVGQETLRRQRERLEEYRAQSQQIARQLKRLDNREREAKERLASLRAEMQQLAQREKECKRRLVQLAEQQKPVEERRSIIRSRQQALARIERDLQQHIRECEGQTNHSSLAVARCEDELHRLQERILQDLGLTQLKKQSGTQKSEGRGDPVGLEQSAFCILLSALQEDIRLLRSQLRDLRRVNPEAPMEYAELKRRHEFLTNQAADLEAAAHSLRQVVAELDRLMESRFRNTFEAVAAQFAEYFPLLFEGGQAQLALTEPQDLSQTGVDIRVRPPGKREQGLALLSGGERALTAVALIFAILTVSSTPFCLLDEVDAMLDEANSGRFRHLLERLAEHTQFIIITHNRQTIEAADTIYGISMDENGVSQVISLRLDEVAAVVGA